MDYIIYQGFGRVPSIYNLMMAGVFIMADEITPIELGRISSPNLT